MKKLICFVLAVLILGSCMTACNFTKNLSGALADKAEATPKVEEMMEALAENRTSDAKTLIHAEAGEKSDAAITQMSDYLSGRGVRSMELKSINVSTSTGTSGKTRQEKAVYQATLTDGDVICLNVTYLSNRTGTGFTSFQLVLGVM